MLLTRDKDFNQQTAFVQNVTTNGVNRLKSVRIKSNSLCVTGFDLVFSDDTSVSLGDENQNGTEIYLSSPQPQLYSFESSCRDICDRIQICSLQDVCAEGGNSDKSYDLPIYIQNLTISALAADFGTYSSVNCVKNVGIFYELSACVPNRCQNGDNCSVVSVDSDTFSCLCLPSFGGEKCEQSEPIFYSWR